MVQEVYEGLPELCYSYLRNTGELIVLKRGESGYYRTDCPTGSIESAKALMEQNNQRLGVSRAQAAAMEVGAMFGWHVPAANPECYDENGEFISKKQKEHGMER